MAVVLVCCGALGYLAAFASSAVVRAANVCSTVGDVSDCLQWNVDGGATKLTVQNTGAGGIASFTFMLPSGANTYGVGGNSSCSNGPQSNEISCGAVPAGQMSSVDILSSAVALGSTGTFTPTDANGVAQPAQTAQLEAASSSTSTTTTTTTTACEATLVVKKRLTTSFVGRKHGIYQVLVSTRAAPHGGAYGINVENTSQCDARNVTVTDVLPEAFSCSVVRPLGKGCHGRGTALHLHIGDVAAGQTTYVYIDGKFVRTGLVWNVASAEADNAAEVRSNKLKLYVVEHQPG